MRHSATIVLLAMAVFAGQAVAQQEAAPGTAQPTPAAQRAKLQFLVGTFATETTIPASPAMPNGATGKGTSVIAWTLDSMFLLIDEQSANSALGQYKGLGVLGYDAVNRQFVLSMFNNYGDRPSYKGDFAGDTLVLQTRVEMPKRAFDQKLLWYREGDAVKLKVLNDVGKGYGVIVEESYVPAAVQKN